jgi:D-serine deaminase-like pyridoxal phosphate-dependent protein
MSKHVNTFRRKMLLGGLATAGLGASAAFLRPKDVGNNHSDHFRDISNALKQAEISKPTLVIDKAALNHNIQALSQHIGDSFKYRIVGKSLPSLPLIKTVMQGTNTQRLMMFHQPFLNQTVDTFPQADILMGKPMPVAAAANFYRQLDASKGFDASRQLQWLIDTPERLRQYQQLSEQLNVDMNINLELDVGLHRGGIKDDQALVEILNLIQADPRLSLSGLMGYEPQIAKVPGNKLALRDKAMQIYSDKLNLAQQVMGQDLSQLTLNAAGSPTYRYYNQEQFPYAKGNFPHNELSAGSCLVKPLDFDLPTLTDHRPASFIATPVLKTLDQTELPGVPGLGKLMAMWNPNRAKTFFTYGGYWKAQPESPQGLSFNPVFGRSSNQEMLNGSKRITLQSDDWMFLRPTQSEFVFLQFGDIAVYDQGEITDLWPAFNAAG